MLGRKEDFDQATDPIVSIQANNLRRALERYYLVAGKQDALRIDIPKGTYVPIIIEQTQVESNRNALISKIPDAGFEEVWPSVLVRSFQNLTGDPELSYFGIGLATELATAIGQDQDIRVLLEKQEGDEKGSSNSVARFAVDGTLRKDREGIKLAVQLIDNATHEQIWADVHRSGLETSTLVALEEDIGRVGCRQNRQ